MEYEAIAGKERLTGRGYFYSDSEKPTTTDPPPSFDLGNIQLMNLDYGIKRKEHYKARRGMIIADRFDAYGVLPKWEITGDEFSTPLLQLIFLGTVAGNVTGASVTAGTFVFKSKKGRSFSTGLYGLNTIGIATVLTGGTPPAGGWVEAYTGDFVLDRGPGKVYVTLNTGIPDTTAITLHYNNPATMYNQIKPPLSTLNFTGRMELIEEDAYDPAPKSIHTFPCILSTDSGGQTKVDDYKQFKLICTVSDPSNWVVLKRGDPTT